MDHKYEDESLQRDTVEAAPAVSASENADVSEQPAAAEAASVPASATEEPSAESAAVPDLDEANADQKAVEADEAEPAVSAEKLPDTAEATEGADMPGAQSAPERADAAKEETVVRYRWNYETQRTVDEQRSAGSRRSGIVTYAVMMTAFFAVSFVILIASLLTGGLTGRPQDAGQGSLTNPSDRVVYIREDDGESGVLTIQEIAEQSKHSVVAVTVKKALGQGTGTGFVLTEDGYIATNYHVVEDSVTVKVVMYDGTAYDATVVNYSEPDDLAVLKIDAQNLPVLPIGNSDDLLVGDNVVVIGHPAGLEYGWSTTNGILSAINREVKIKNKDGTLNKKMTLLQTNANVNSGNSGGPMLDEQGRVIGIISMKLANGYEGMGFAIPINGAMEIIEAIIEKGHADDVDSSVSKGRPVLGVTGMDVLAGYTIVLHDDDTMSRFPTGAEPAGVPEGERFDITQSGFLISEVNESADAFGKLKRGDVIVGIDGTQTSNRMEMMAILDDKDVGDGVVIDFIRDGELSSVKIKLSPENP